MGERVFSRKRLIYGVAATSMCGDRHVRAEKGAAGNSLLVNDGRGTHKSRNRAKSLIALSILALALLPRQADAAKLTLQWDPPSDGTATGYVLLYGTLSQSYPGQVDVGSATSYTLDGLFEGATYYFAVRAYDARGTLSPPSAEVSGTTGPAVTPVAPVVTPVVTALSLTASVPSPQLVGTSVMWSAAASGGIAPYQYQWSLYQAGNWTALPWTDAATWSWTPTVAGDYQVRVAVRSAGNTSTTGELSRSMSYTVNAPAVSVDAPVVSVDAPVVSVDAPVVSDVTLKPNLAPPQPPGTTVVWSASASGSVGPLHYRWWLFDGTTWTPMTPWTTSATWPWTPKTPGDGYIVQVQVRRATQATDAAEATAAARFPVQPGRGGSDCAGGQCDQGRGRSDCERGRCN